MRRIELGFVGRLGTQAPTTLVLVAIAALPAMAAETGVSKPERIALWPDLAPVGDGTHEAANAYLTVYRAAPEKADGAAVVICPGGGYGTLVVGPEGHGIAQWLVGHGIAGLVLEYRLPRGRPMVPLLDAQRALRTARSRARQWNLDPARIGIMGFSAGGHLASTAGTHFDQGDAHAADPVDRASCRPDFMILVYPVITMDRTTHGGSRANLLGPNPTPDWIRRFSNETQVTDQTPPAFLAHAKDDKAVSPDNSRRFYEALRSHRVAAEYLELPEGGHGLNGYKGPMWTAWQTAALRWLESQKLIGKAPPPPRGGAGAPVP
jgi:acetyl esterase/lipase